MLTQRESEPPYLLSNSRVERASPHALEVIFGPDGAHPDAPPFVALLLDLNDETGRTWRMSHTLENGVLSPAWEQGSWAFDLRVPSVAERLMRVSMGALVHLDVHADPPTLRIEGQTVDVEELGHGQCARVGLYHGQMGELLNAWNAGGRSLYPRHGDIAPWSCQYSFIASLVLTTAEKRGLRPRL